MSEQSIRDGAWRGAILGALSSAGFHARHGWFNVREQFSDLAGGIAGFLLFPFFIWLLGRIWGRFNAHQGHYTLQEVMLYVGATEMLFLTFIRPASVSRASGDFSIALARPRSWVAMSLSGLSGRCLGGRIVYLAIFAIVLPLLGASPGSTAAAVGRLALLLPILGVAQALIGLLFASAQILWEETSYFMLPVSKIFLSLGGVFGPLADYGEPWRAWLLALPPSDLFFQAAHFSVKGEFYGMGPLSWFIRVCAFCLVLAATNAALYRFARRHHRSYGG